MSKSLEGRTVMSIEPVPGDEPDGFTVTFRGADGSETSGTGSPLPAGKVGTWELEVTVVSEIGSGGGFLFQRRGFRVGYLLQDYNHEGRDYATLEAHCDAELHLIVNTFNQQQGPRLAQVVVSSGTLNPGDRFILRLGDRRRGGLGTEVYDSCTIGRLVAAVDRDGSGTFRELAASPLRMHITSEPSPDLLCVLGPSIVEPGEAFHVNVAVFDPNRNVCEQYGGEVELVVPKGVE